MAGLPFAKTGAVIYCRVSTQDQLENFSLETQERRCREYCERKGYTIATLFSEAFSAKDANRPRFQEMLQFCEQNKTAIGVVVVYNVSRFSRNTSVHLNARAKLKLISIRLESATEAIDQTPLGKYFEQMLAAGAEFENSVKAERTKEGMLAALGRGHWVYKAYQGRYVDDPYGFWTENR